MASVSGDALWSFIKRAVEAGVALYAVIVVIGALMDVLSAHISRSPRLVHHDPRLLPRYLHMRVRFMRAYSGTGLFYVIEVVRFAFNLAACAVYVIGTYQRTVKGAVRALNLFLGSLLAVDLLLGLLFADSALIFVFTLNILFQSLSLPSFFLAHGSDSFLNLSFLRALTVYMTYRSVDRRLFAQMKSSKSLLLRLFVKCIAMVYILAGGVQLLEIPGDILGSSFESIWVPLGEWHFFNAVYYVVVTLSTVGYGDYTPLTILGRLFVVFMIVVGVIIFSNSISQLVENAQRNRGSGSFTKKANSRHVIVSGCPQLSDLVRFTSEFFATCRVSNSTAKVVVMVSRPSWSDAEWHQSLAKNEFLRKRVVSLVGNIRSSTDLNRARITTADAMFFIVSPSNGHNAKSLDMSTVIDILAVRNVRTDIPIYTTVLLNQSLVQMQLAQSIPASANDPNLLFRHEMPALAQYHGLSREIVAHELQSVPTRLRKHYLHMAYARGARDLKVFLGVPGLLGEVGGAEAGQFRHRRKKSALQNSAPDPDPDRDTRAMSAPAIGDMKHDTSIPGEQDLARSTSVCLQDIHSAVIAAHVSANGVGTLIANMVLDFNTQSSRGDPPWLLEYHLGAMCQLTYLVIPQQLDGVRIDDIAAQLYDHGLVLVAATDDVSESYSRIVLGTREKLVKGHIGMFLTYHERRYAHPALMLAAFKCEERFKGFVREGRASERNSKCSGHPHESGAVQDDESASRHVRHPQKVASDASNGKCKDETNFRNLSAKRKNRKFEAHTSEGLPCNDAVQAAEHTKGSSDSSTEKHLLEEEDSDSSHFTRDLDASTADSVEPKVSSGMRLISHSEDIISHHMRCSDGYIPDGLRRHIIISAEGASPLDNLALLLKYLWRSHGRRSRRQRRRPRVPIVVIHPAFPSGFRSPYKRYDGKDLFFIEDSSASRDTWKRARLKTAKGVIIRADYGISWQESDARTIFSIMTLDTFIKSDQDVFVVSELIEEKSLEFLREPLRPRRIGVNFGETGCLPAESEPVSGCQLRPSSALDKNLQSSSRDADDSKISLGSSYSIGEGNGRGNQETTKPSYMPRFLASSRMERLEIVPPSGLTGSPEEILTRSQASHAKRGTLFSRNRYASGDLLIHSSALTLLVREYLEPGFVHFYTELLGAGEELGALKIRLVRVPFHMFEEDMIVNGEYGCRYIMYRDVFTRLMQLGTTALGLYRSGAAPVRVPTRRRIHRGPEMETACNAYLGETMGMTGLNDARKRGLAGFFRQWFDDFRESMPSVQKEHRRNEAWMREEGLEVDIDADTVDEDGESESNIDGLSARQGIAVELAQPSESQSLQGSMPWTSARVESVETNPADAAQTGMRKLRQMRPTLRRENTAKLPADTYREYNSPSNRLPYVLTMPEPFTLVSEKDGVYILCNPDFELPSAWCEGYRLNSRDNSYTT